VLVSPLCLLVSRFYGWDGTCILPAKVDAELRARTERTRQEMAKLETQRKDLERYFNQKDIANLHDRAAFINTILDARSFNWTLMFMDLERILPGGVRVISIEPRQVAGRVRSEIDRGRQQRRSRTEIRACPRRIEGIRGISNTVCYFGHFGR